MRTIYRPALGKAIRGLRCVLGAWWWEIGSLGVYMTHVWPSARSFRVWGNGCFLTWQAEESICIRRERGRPAISTPLIALEATEVTGADTGRPSLCVVFFFSLPPYQKASTCPGSVAKLKKKKKDNIVLITSPTSTITTTQHSHPPPSNHDNDVRRPNTSN